MPVHGRSCMRMHASSSEATRPDGAIGCRGEREDMDLAGKQVGAGLQQVGDVEFRRQAAVLAVAHLHPIQPAVEGSANALKLEQDPAEHFRSSTSCGLQACLKAPDHSSCGTLHVYQT